MAVISLASGPFQDFVMPRPAGEGVDPSKDSDEEEEARKGRVELIDNEANVNPVPFKFKPYTLVYILDPKNIELLESLGGMKGLLKGLGMSWMRELGRKALMQSNSFKVYAASDDRPGLRLLAPHNDMTERRKTCQELSWQILKMEGSLTMRTTRITQYSLRHWMSIGECMGKMSFHIGF